MKNTFQSIGTQIARLIDVKSIVTLALVATLVVTTLNGAEVCALFSNSVMLVLGFFFGKTNQVVQNGADGVKTESAGNAGSMEKTVKNGTEKE